MKYRNTLILLAITAILVVTSGVVIASDGPNHPGTIRVYGEGEMEVFPDQAIISVGVETNDPRVEIAVSENARMMEAVSGVLDSYQSQISSVTTGSYHVYNMREQERTEYRVSSILTVTLDDLAELGPVIDHMISAGANRVESVRFAVKEGESLKLEALQAAVRQGQRKAQAVADALGVQLGSMISITEEQGGFSPYQMADTRAFGLGETEIRPANVKLSARVSMEYSIKPIQDSNNQDELGPSLDQLGQSIPFEQVERMTLKNTRDEEVRILDYAESEQLVTELNANPTYLGVYPMVLVGNQASIELNDGRKVTLTSFGSPEYVVVGGGSWSSVVVAPQTAALLLAKQQ